MHNQTNINYEKLVTTFKVFAMLSVMALYSCQNENNEMNQQEAVQAKTTIDELKKKLLLRLLNLFPEAVQLQLNESTKNLETYLKMIYRL